MDTRLIVSTRSGFVGLVAPKLIGQELIAEARSEPALRQAPAFVDRHGY